MEKAFEELKNRALLKGYITFDEIIHISDKIKLSLAEIDSLTGHLMDEGFLILEETPSQETGETIIGNIYDKSKIDYEKVFRSALKIAPQLSNYIDDLRNIPAPRKGEEDELVYLAKDGNEYAFNRLIRMFLKVVLRNALYLHKKYGLPLEETIQEGNIGLIISIEKFEVKSGNRFSSYAPWWIRQNILRHTTGICDKYYIPVHLQEELLKLISHIGPKSLEIFQGDLLRSINIPLAEKVTKIKKDKIIQYLTYLEEPYSLESFECEQNPPYFEFCDIENEALNYLYFYTISKHIFSFLDQLADRDRKIFCMRYGLEDYFPMTLEEVAVIIGVTRERIRQIESKLLSKIKRDIQKYV